METNVGIGVVPVAAGPMPPVDERDRRLRFAQKRIGEVHADRAGADDQIVGFDRVTGREFPRCEFLAVSHGASRDWL